MAWDPLVSVDRMLTILVYWLAAQTALTFILHVSLQVYSRAFGRFGPSLSRGGDGARQWSRVFSGESRGQLCVWSKEHLVKSYVQ